MAAPKSCIEFSIRVVPMMHEIVNVSGSSNLGGTFRWIADKNVYLKQTCFASGTRLVLVHNYLMNFAYQGICLVVLIFQDLQLSSFASSLV